MSRRRSGQNRRNGRSSAGAAERRRAGQPGPGVTSAPAAAADHSTEPEALVVTYALDREDDLAPDGAVVRISGRRLGPGSAERGRESFSQDEKLEGMVPGSGPASVTSWIYGLQPGEWATEARLIPVAPALHPRPAQAKPLMQADWSWRQWRLIAVPPRPTKTRWSVLAPLARQPAVLPGAYTLLAALGFIFAFWLQSVLLIEQSVPFGGPLVASLVATGAGLAGAKLWYKLLHPDERLIGGGWAVDGFVVAFPVALAWMLHVFDLPFGAVVDATTPGIFLAVAIGRVGCFVTGCCAGQMSASRWAIWSSDRRVGARRIPAQLLEALAGLQIGAAALLFERLRILPAGLVFVAAFVLYAVLRQGLLRLRAERRRDLRTLPATAAAAGLVAAAITILVRVHGG